MRKSVFASLSLAATAALLSTGCSGPAYKLGRGINNMTEIARGGEMRRSIEQASLWEGPDSGFTFGAIQGFNRTVARTVVGVVEVATFPIPTPSYDPLVANDNWDKGDVYVGGPLRNDHIFSLNFMTANPRYPSNYEPNRLSDSLFDTDTNIGYSSGDIAPFVPGSRFFIFDQ